MLEDIELPTDWYKLQLNKHNRIYVNVKENICSFAPVFSIFKIYDIMNSVMGMKLDCRVVDQEIEKIKKTLNLTLKAQQIFENNEILQQRQELIQTENDKVQKELQDQLTNINININAQLSEIQGELQDEMCLLTEVAGRYFQSIPHHSDIIRKQEVPELRFLSTVLINGRELGRGVGPNKRQARLHAAQQALKNICPQILEEWKQAYRNEGQIDHKTENLKEETKYQKLELTIQNNDKLIQQDIENSMSNNESTYASQSNFTPDKQATPVNQHYEEDLDEGMLVEDAKIDDVDLMYGKKHLCQKYTPLTIIKSLEGKHKNLSFQENISESKDLKKNHSIFTVEVSLKGYPKFQGVHVDNNKQRARTIAGQRFLKSLFPLDVTWNGVISLVSGNKEPLKMVLDL
eukprot:403367994